jgi:hypothetical protein
MQSEVVMRFITAEEMMVLLEANRSDPAYLQLSGESHDNWLQRTTLLALQGLEDESNPVISAEEWSRMKDMYRDYCLQTGRSHDEVS